MADVKKSAPKPKAAKKPKGPKFAARFVDPQGSAVVRIRTRFKHHSNSYEVESLFYPKGDAAPSGKGSRADNALIYSTSYATFAEAQAAALSEVETAKKKGFVPQEKTGKRTPIGWDAL